MNEYLQYILDGFIYIIIDAITFGLGLAILIKIINWLSPLKGLEKIKENNIATAIIWATIFVIFAAFTISGWFVPEV